MLTSTLWHNIDTVRFSSSWKWRICSWMRDVICGINWYIITHCGSKNWGIQLAKLFSFSIYWQSSVVCNHTNDFLSWKSYLSYESDDHYFFCKLMSYGKLMASYFDVWNCCAHAQFFRSQYIALHLLVNWTASQGFLQEIWHINITNLFFVRRSSNKTNTFFIIKV